ncbi:MAG: hypothetical protein WC900_05375, partial [Oscillospiraceae bacterium]
MKGVLTFKKVFSICIVIVICVAFAGQVGSQSIQIEAKTLSQLQQERDALSAKIADNQKKQKEYANQITATQNSISQEEENQ